MRGGDQAQTAGEWRFTIPVLPPSVNSLHNIIYSQRKVVLKPEVLKWRSDASCYIPRMRIISTESVIEIDCTFYYRFYTKSGKLRIFDTQNLVKSLLDTIAWKAGFDDKRVKRGSWDSVNDDNERVEVRLREIAAPTATQPERG